MKIILNIIFLFFSIICCGQDQLWHKGEIIDSVSIDSQSKESFALYLPNSFDIATVAPVIFIFDPAGRGAKGIYPFIKASETYGYILICSNDTRNGPYGPNYEIATRLFQKVFQDFLIDQNRIYTSGFSGGSKLAASIAIITGSVRGIIACGAGFSSTLNLIGTEISFSYASIVGDEDMNYSEMIKTRDYLNKIKVNNELFVYEFNHKWPSQDQVLRAVDWLHLQAIRNRIIPQNDKKIEDIYLNYYDYASQLEDENKFVYSSDEYNRIIRNFQKSFDVDSIRTHLKELEKNNSIDKKRKELKSIFDKETYLNNLFTKRLYDELKAQNGNVKWWNSQIDKLNKKLEKADVLERKMINRVLYKIFAMAIEAVEIKGYKNVKQLIVCNDICIVVYPKYALPYFKQMENFINLNDKDMALSYLDKLIKTGYTDYKTIEENKMLDPLKESDVYKQLIKN